MKLNKGEEIEEVTYTLSDEELKAFKKALNTRFGDNAEIVVKEAR